MLKTCSPAVSCRNSYKTKKTKKNQAQVTTVCSERAGIQHTGTGWILAVAGNQQHVKKQVFTFIFYRPGSAYISQLTVKVTLTLCSKRAIFSSLVQTSLGSNGAQWSSVSCKQPCS